MSTFDRRLQALADDAAAAHLRSAGLGTAAVRERVRRGRLVRGAGFAAASGAGVAAVIWLGVSVTGPGPDQPAPVGTPTASVTTVPSPGPGRTATAQPPDAPDTGPVVEGWRDAGVPTQVFGEVRMSGAVVLDGRTVVVGCDVGAFAVGGETTFGVWVGTDPTTWRAVTAPAGGEDPPTECLDAVVDSPHGLYAHGQGLYHSPDGERWERVETDAWADGGWVDAVVAVGDRVTVLLGHAGLNESSTASLHTTTDGTRWTQLEPAVAEVFDNARVAQVIEGGDGLLAVGSSPGGEYVPTAAAWTSADGMTWRRVTPTGDGFADCFAAAVAATPQGFTAVGGCPFTSRPMAAWSSPDGISWTPDPTPMSPEGRQALLADATGVLVLGDDRYAVGGELGGAAGAPPIRPVVWRSAAGGPWELLDQDPPSALPLVPTTVGGVAVGFWTGTGPTRGLVPDD